MIKMFQRCLCLVLSLSLISLISFPAAQAFAEEVPAEDLFSIMAKQTVQSATLSPIAVSKTPGTVSVITHKQIEEAGANTLEQVLALLPGVDTRMGPMGSATLIRGAGGSPFQEGIQYQIDGYLYNSPDKGGSAANPGYNSFPVPIEMIEQVEVIREPISSLYGPNAFYGVINIITKRGKNMKNGGSVAARASDQNLGRNYQRYSAVGGGVKGEFDGIGAVDYSRQLGLTKVTNNTAYNWNGAASTKYKNWEVSAFGMGSESEPFLSDGNRNTKQTRQDVVLAGANYSKDVTDTINVNAKTSYLTRRGTNCMVCHNPGSFLTVNPRDDQEYFQRFYERVHANWIPNEANKVTAGVEVMYDQEHMDASTLQTGRLDARTYSGFVQYVRAIREDLSATVGIRHDRSDWSNESSATNPRALLVYTPTDKTTVRAGFSQAARVPTFHDLQLFMKLAPTNPNEPNAANVRQPNGFLMGNPDLKPEKINTYTLGADHWFGKKFIAKINGYYSVVTDAIERKTLTTAETVALLPGGRLPDGSLPRTTGPANNQTNAQRWINLPANVLIAGGEFETEYVPNRYLTLNLNYGYKDVQYTSDIVAITGGLGAPPNAARHMLGAGITAHPMKKLMVNVTGRFRSEVNHALNKQRLSFTVTPDTFYMDTHVSYHLPYGLRASFIGKNLFAQEPKDWPLALDTRLTTGQEFFAQLAWDFGGYQQP